MFCEDESLEGACVGTSVGAKNDLIVLGTAEGAIISKDLATHEMKAIYTPTKKNKDRIQAIDGVVFYNQHTNELYAYGSARGDVNVSHYPFDILKQTLW